jgi:hypothetical protein
MTGIPGVYASEMSAAYIVPGKQGIESSKLCTLFLCYRTLPEPTPAMNKASFATGEDILYDDPWISLAAR